MTLNINIDFVDLGRVDGTGPAYRLISNGVARENVVVNLVDYPIRDMLGGEITNIGDETINVKMDCPELNWSGVMYNPATGGDISIGAHAMYYNRIPSEAMTIGEHNITINLYVCKGGEFKFDTPFVSIPVRYSCYGGGKVSVHFESVPAGANVKID